MKEIAFDRSLSVGNADIDAQHEEIIRIFGQLERHQADGSGSSQRIHNLISNLIIIMTKHFFDEEELLLRNGCPRYAAHAREHAYFIERLSQALQMDEQEIIDRGIPSLANLMMGHLMTEDLAARAYLAAATEDKLD